LTKAVEQVKHTLTELDLSVNVYSEQAEEIECIELPSDPVIGQLGSLWKFSRLRKLKAPIVTLLGWSLDKPHRLLAEVVPAG
jgi:hypothetical protein